MSFRNCATLLRLAPLVLLLCGGCATKALWEKSGFDAFNQPADDPRLRLYYDSSQQDLLVVYDEYSERHDSTRHRAYWLFKNQLRTEGRHRPDFVSENLARGLTTVPVYSETNTPAAASPETLYAVASDTGFTFALYSGDHEINSCRLPVYNDHKGQLERIALTPLAATADLTIVGGYLGVGLLYGLGESGYSISTGK